MSAENQDVPVTNDDAEKNAGEAPSLDENVPPRAKTSLMLIAGLVCSVLALLAALGGFAYLQSGKADHGELRALRAELKKREMTIADLLLRIDNLTADVTRLSEAEEARVEAAEKAHAEAEKAREAAAVEAAELAAKAGTAEKAGADKVSGKGGGKVSDSAVRAGEKVPRVVPVAPVVPATPVAPAKRASDSKPEEGAKPPPSVAPLAPSAPGASPRSENKVEKPVAGAPAAKGSTQNCDLMGKTPEEQAATLKRCVSLIDPPTPQSRQR